MIQGTHNAVEDPRNKDVKIFINGDLFAREEAKISVLTAVTLLGMAYGKRCVFMMMSWYLDRHLNRLWPAAATVGMARINRLSLSNRTERNEKIEND